MRLLGLSICMVSYLFCQDLLIGIEQAWSQVATSIAPTTGVGNLGTAVSQSGPSYNITGGTRAGTNVFHSFGSFSIAASDTANFLNTPVNGSLPFTTNILSRV